MSQKQKQLQIQAKRTDKKKSKAVKNFSKTLKKAHF